MIDWWLQNYWWVAIILFLVGLLGGFKAGRWQRRRDQQIESEARARRSEIRVVK